MLIGQQKLMNDINTILEQYPRFSIICGFRFDKQKKTSTHCNRLLLIVSYVYIK